MTEESGIASATRAGRRVNTSVHYVAGSVYRRYERVGILAGSVALLCFYSGGPIQ